MIKKSVTYRRFPMVKRRKSTPYRKILIGLLIVTILSFLKLWQRVDVGSEYRRNDQLREELNSLQGENALLEAKIEELCSAERLTAIASEKLHMVQVPKISLQEKNALEKLTKKLDKLQK